MGTIKRVLTDIDHKVKTIGILGGGQLAKMLSLAAAKIGFKTHIYCSSIEEPALQSCTLATIGSFFDEQKISIFASSVDCITIETENTPPKTLDICAQHTYSHITSSIISQIQNRPKEKLMINHLGIATTEFCEVNDETSLKQAISTLGIPLILKTSELGYDGKGQRIINNPNDQVNINSPMIAEKLVEYTKEVSIVCSRDQQGNIEFFPVAENIHENGILRISKVPANISIEQQKTLELYADTLLKGMNFIGILAIECFIEKTGRVLINELAPRPHNSAHWTIDACNISQFEQLVRIISGLPMKTPKLLFACTTKNLLGEEILNWEQHCADPDSFPMVYGKKFIANQRKMGHVNILSELPNEPI